MIFRGWEKNKLLKKRGDYNINNICEYIILFLQKMQIKKVYPVGLSMGGSIAIWLYLKYPQYCIGSTVCAPVSGIKSINPCLALLTPKLGFFNTFIFIFLHVVVLLSFYVISPFLFLYFFYLAKIKKTYSQKEIHIFMIYVRYCFKNPVKFITKCSRAADMLNNENLHNIFINIKKPFHLFWGNTDTLVDKKHFLPLIQHISCVQYHEIKNAGHFIPLTHPKLLASCIKKDIKRRYRS